MNEERAKRAEEQRRGANKNEGSAHTILACDDHASWHACKQCGGERRGGDVTEAMILHSARRAAGREACYSGEKLIHSALSVIKNEMLQRSGSGRDQMATKIEVLNLQNS